MTCEFLDSQGDGPAVPKQLPCPPQVMAGRGQGLGQSRSSPVQQRALVQQKPSQKRARSLPVLPWAWRLPRLEHDAGTEK